MRSEPSSSKSVALLDLFAFGTLQTLKGKLAPAIKGLAAERLTENVEAFPPIIPSQLQKLKHLTLVSLALQNRSLDYDRLLTSLDITSVRDLEDLIIDTIYAGLLTGKMHHHERVLHVDWVAGRDLRPEDLQTIRQGLENWCATASTLLKALDEQIAHVRQVSAGEATEAQVYEADRNAIVETLMNTKSSAGKGHSLRGHEPWDVGQEEDAIMNGSASGSGSGRLSAILSGLGGSSGGRKWVRLCHSPVGLVLIRSTQAWA